MKLKILFFPLSLATAIVLFIWFIHPEFSQFKEDRNELDAQRNILREVKIKKQNINNLNASLDDNLDKEKLILEYLPPFEKEEDIINALNYLATSSGTVLVDFEANIVKGNLGRSKIPKTGEENAAETVKHKTKAILNLTGSYENIRSFFDQIYRMKRANNISMVNISSQPESENLLAKAEIYFDYLPQSRLSLENELSDPIFSQKSFDFTVADKVKELTGGDNISKLETGSVGRSNPFLP